MLRYSDGDIADGLDELEERGLENLAAQLDAVHGVAPLTYLEIEPDAGTLYAEAANDVSLELQFGDGSPSYGENAVRDSPREEREKRVSRMLFEGQTVSKGWRSG